MFKTTFLRVSVAMFAVIVTTAIAHADRSLIVAKNGKIRVSNRTCSANNALVAQRFLDVAGNAFHEISPFLFRSPTGAGASAQAAAAKPPKQPTPDRALTDASTDLQAVFTYEADKRAARETIPAAKAIMVGLKYQKGTASQSTPVPGATGLPNTSTPILPVAP